MGERFTLIDPARLPEKTGYSESSRDSSDRAFSGNRRRRGNGISARAADKSARSPEDLAKTFPFPVLAEIPEIITLQDERRRKKSLKTIAGVVLLSLVIVVLIFHFFVMDLDVCGHVLQGIWPYK